MLTTKYVPEMVTVHKRRGDIMKPKFVIEYNKHKSYIDISDQMKAYNSSLRRGVKWYRKLATELVGGAAIVNSHWLHQRVTNNKMSITKFREEVIKGLLKRAILPDNLPILILITSYLKPIKDNCVLTVIKKTSRKWEEIQQRIKQRRQNIVVKRATNMFA
ncbi:uncharacterized protein [Leptinotarsa decemlineata]|uniref:uncharacterized protein n=1 Tax=Leptinotarsa decemlineata TaxID=7539 RepID=UPI003D305035